MSQANETLVFSGPVETNCFRLISIKHQLRLEKAGMKSSGGALRPRLAAEFGLSPKASHEAFIAAIQGQIDTIQAARASVAAM